MKGPSRRNVLLEFEVYCAVRPLARPRRGKGIGSMYQPKENQAELYTELLLYKREHPFDHPIIVDSFVYFEGKGKSGHPTDPQYGDEDNLRKAINDGLQHCGIIKNDALVVGGLNFKQFADESYCHIKIWDLNGTKTVPE